MKLNSGSLKRCIISLSLALACVVFAAPAWSDHDRLRNEVRQFHRFLQNHPKVKDDLRNNPKLVNNKKYLDKHDDLENFLKRYPRVSQEIVNHPSQVFGTYYEENHR